MEREVCFQFVWQSGSNASGARAGATEGRRSAKGFKNCLYAASCKIVFLGGTSYFLRYSIYRLATMHNVTDSQPDRQTDKR